MRKEEKMRKSEKILFENTPAEYFTDAYPIGNGRLGGMVWGSPKLMKIGLNLDELWCGGECDPTDAWNIEDYKEARRLALLGKYADASDYLAKTYSKFNSMAYHTLGDLFFEMKDGDVSEYRRELDIYDGIASVAYKLDGKSIVARSFASYPDGVIVTKINSEAATDIKISMASPQKCEIRASEGIITMTGECRDRSQYHVERDSFPPDRPGMPCVSFCAKVSLESDGKIESLDGTLTVKDATFLNAYFTAASSYLDGYAAKNTEYECQAALTAEKALKKGYDAIFEEHKRDINSLFDRMELSLGEEFTEDITTGERINRFDPEIDADLITLVFNFGRYLLISGSREGSRALNLQGIWNDSLTPPWSSNYTTNINAQMNYWPALPTGLTELLGPFEEQVRLIARHGRNTAKKLFGAGGIAASHNSDIFGFATPVQGLTQWAFFPLSYHWMMRELYNRYEYTLDAEYLKSVYELFEGGAEFVLDMLVDDGEYLIFSPGTSPENSFVFDPETGRTSEAAKSSEMYAAIIRDTIRIFIESSEVLKINSALLERARAARPRLLPSLITDDGRIAEWYIGDGKNNPPEVEVNHRHISHLYALYPAHEITVNSGALKEAAERSLDVRGDASTGWSLGWKLNCRARLCDGDAVMRLLRLFFNHVHSSIVTPNFLGGVYKNLFCAHPPFQIDGNFAFTAAVCEMLVQEIDGEVVALPALPKEIKCGSAKGIRLRGNKKVDLAFKDGKITEFRIY